MSPHVFRYEVSPHLWVYLACRGVLHTHRSKFQKIEVVDSYDLGRMLVLDGVINLTERDECVYHEMLVHVPVFSHPDPSQVLIVGGGDGGTARELVKHAGIKDIRQVEIDAEVIAVAKEYFPSLGHALDDPKVNVMIMDAIQYLRETRERFDVILIDSTDPVIGQSAGLFTAAFYRDCLNALTDEGILAAQIGDIVFDRDIVVPVYRKLKEVFPIVKIFRAPIPAYTIVPFSFACCSKTEDPEKGPDISRFDPGFQTRYYNPEIHRAAFALPEQLKRDLRE